MRKVQKNEMNDRELLEAVHFEKSGCPGRNSGHCSPQAWDDFVEFHANLPPDSDIDAEYEKFINGRRLCTFCNDGQRFDYSQE